MFIPTRSNSRARAQGYSVNTEQVDYFTPEKHHRHRGLKKQSHEQHKGIPPAVAALLAVTTIQRKPQRISGSGGNRGRKASLEIYVESSSVESISGSAMSTLLVVDEQVEDSGMIFGSYEDNELVSFSRSNSSMALSLLLSPPDEFDDKDFCSSSVHSSSSESLPALEADDGSSTHSMDAISPKATAPRPKTRAISPEACALDHPLAFVKEEVAQLPSSPIVCTKIVAQAEKQGFRNVLSFKSNLTAVLKSAAKSLSAFAPLTLQDDMLTRSILSNNPRYADEKRPTRLSHTQEFPTPALRRYLNPGPTAGLMDSSSTHCTGAIQMQTYHRTRRSSSSRNRNRQAPQPAAQHPPLRTDEGDTPRPREPRENSDFLRVIVLEMNMRRQGKLSDTAQGKARLVLPPRRQPSKRTPGAARRIGEISARW
ncbi:hypothetical protein DFH27DRAFT_530461 [Peziza echinospora]|nr:hypothetical protein DFH27DRAFT_530461 [Peziza echinospora]